MTDSMINYTFPFEGDEHLGTIILLPYREDTWENGGAIAKDEFLNLVKAISNHETVYLIKSPKVKYSIEDFKIENVTILELPYDDSWARDNTLIFTLTNEGKIRAVDYKFNAWGGNVDGLYDNWEDDDKLGKALANVLNVNRVPDKDFILEGGSIHTNGKGLLLTTEACLLSEGRNKNLTKEEIEQHLKDTLGMQKVIWLPHGIVNDETNEHVDNMACFLDEETVLLATSKDTNDLQYKWSMEALDILENETTVDGKPLNVILVNCPNPYLTLTEEESKQIVSSDQAKARNAGDRLAASYVNFYMGKDFICLPKFNVKEDEEAYEILNNFYKGSKKIYQIESRKILVAGGNIHCVTMQIAKGEK
ncbi:MAG: agmatine deiminase family protein [Acholeplasmatales bacterium]|nr:agmatine deiminase family protein [Acholeplasmatales bacterium]